MDQEISLSRALGQVFDLVVLHTDLLAQEFVLALHSLDVGCRDRSRLVRCQRFPRNLLLAFNRDDRCRDRSRHVGTGRDRSHLFDIGDVLGNRGRGDQILFAELGFDAPAVEVSFGAIALDASGSSGVAGMIVALGRFVDRKGIFAVGGRRDRSRQVFRHALMISQPATSLRGYPHMRKGILVRIGHHRPKLSELL